MKTDVLIVGAGPTGLSLAAQFLRYGIDFVIIDKKEATTPYSKAIGVQARTLEIYEQIGIADELIAQGTIAEAARFIEGGIVRGEVPLSRIGEGMSPYPFLLLVEQGKHERILHESIRSQGSEIRWQTELVDLSQDQDGVSAKIRNIDGSTENIDSKYVVGCDGAKSFVRQRLGLQFEGGTFERLFYVADVEIEWEFAHEALHVCLAKNTITAFFPMSGSEKNFRIVGTFPEGHDKDENEILYDEIERRIVADTELNLDITKVNWFSVYKVHSRSVNKFSEGRCFLAGDSAHIHTPAGAQGMNTGIQDGYNLAWKLAMVLNGSSSAKILNSYNEERLPNARRLLQTTDRFFQLGASDDWFLSFIRTNLFPHVAGFALGLDVVRRAIFPLVSQIGINYRQSSLSVDNAGITAAAGDRMPYFEIDGTSLYDRLSQPRFHLVRFTDGRQEEKDLANELVERYGDLMDLYEAPLYPDIAKKLGTDSAVTLLLRPDNYIGLITAGNSVEEIDIYLERILRS